MGWGDPRTACRYAPGVGTVLVGAEAVLLLPLPLSHPLIDQCWQLIAADAPWEEVADIVLSAGLRGVAGFCLVDRRGSGELVARGPLTIELTGESGQRSDQAGTWTQRSLAEIDTIDLALDPTGSPTVPLGFGIASAGRVRLGTGPAAPIVGGAGPDPVGQQSPARRAPAEQPPAALPEPPPSLEASMLHDDTRPEVPAVDGPPPPVPARSSALQSLFEETRLPDPAGPPSFAPAPSAAADEKPEVGALTLPPHHTSIPSRSEPELASPPAAPPAPQPPPPLPPSTGFIAAVPDFGAPAGRPDHPTPAHQAPAVIAPPVAGQPIPRPREGTTGPERGFGMTVSLDQLRASGAGSDGPEVYASRCPRGHINPAHAGICRVCRQQIPPQNPFATTRPPLGRLVLPGGDAVTLDRGAILGRDPSLPANWTGEQPHLVRLTNPDEDVSRQHLEIRLDMFHVLVRDLGSQNGTELVTPDGERRTLRSGELVPIEPGTTIVLAETVPVRFEVTA